MFPSLPLVHCSRFHPNSVEIPFCSFKRDSVYTLAEHVAMPFKEGSWRIGLFHPKISPKNQPKSSLGALVRLSQAQKCDSNPSNKFFMEFEKFLINQILCHSLTHSPSVTQQWMWLRVWFLYCSTSLCPEMCLFPNHRTYNVCIMDLPLFSFVFQFFSLPTLGVDLQ